jgi:hypothetical protein
MSFFKPQNPGIGGLNELTPAEEIFITTLAGLSYSENDVLIIKNGVLSWEPMGETNYSTRVATDSGDSTIKYVGDAVAGASESASSWRIQKVATISGGVTITWADGNTNFDNVWDSGGATPEYETHTYT